MTDTPVTKFFSAVRNWLTSRDTEWDVGEPCSSVVADEFLRIHHDRITRLAEAHMESNMHVLTDADEHVYQETPNLLIRHQRDCSTITELLFDDNVLTDNILLTRGDHSDERDDILEGPADRVIPQTIDLMTREACRIFRNRLTHDSRVSVSGADAFLSTHRALIRSHIETLILPLDGDHDALEGIMRWEDSEIQATFSDDLVRLIEAECGVVTASG